MDIRKRNIRRRWTINTMMVLVLSISLFIFYYYFVQTSFGISNNRITKQYSDIAMVDVFYKSKYQPYNLKTMGYYPLVEFLDKADNVKDYTIMFSDEVRLFYTSKNNKRYGSMVFFTSENGIGILNPKMVAGTSVYKRTQAKERRKCYYFPPRWVTCEYNGNGDSIMAPEYVDSLMRFDKFGAIISRTMAEHLFGEAERAVGKEIVWNDKINYMRENVIGVYEDVDNFGFLKNAVFLCMKDGNAQSLEKYHMAACVKLEDKDCYDQFQKDLMVMNDSIYPEEEYDYNYTVVKDHSTYESILEDAEKNDVETDDIKCYGEGDDQEFFISAKGKERKVSYSSVRFTQYKTLPFNSKLRNSIWTNMRMSSITLTTSIFMVLLAFICMFCISITSMPSEMKDINTRIILGTQKREIWCKIVGRYVLIALTAFVFAMLIIIIVQGGSNVFTRMATISFSIADNMGVVVLSLLVALVIGTATGLYASSYSTNVSMASILKGRVGIDRKRMKWRDRIIFFQFLITNIILIFFIFLCALCRRVIYLCFNIKMSLMETYCNYYSGNMEMSMLMSMMMFAICCILIVGTTLFCTVFIERQYMVRSIAIRRCLGYTDGQLTLMTIWHYLKMAFLALALSLILVLGGSIAVSHNIDIKNLIIAVIIYSIPSLIVNVWMIIIPIVFHTLCTKEMNIAEAIKNE